MTEIHMIMTANALRNVVSIQRKMGESRYREMMEVADKTQAKSSVLDDR